MQEPLVHEDRLRPLGQFFVCQSRVKQRHVGYFRIRELKGHPFVLGACVLIALLLFVEFAQLENRFGYACDRLLLIAAFSRNVLELAVPCLRVVEAFFLVKRLRDHPHRFQGMGVLWIAVDDHFVNPAAFFEQFVVIENRRLDEQDLGGLGAGRIERKVIVARFDHELRGRGKRLDGRARGIGRLFFRGGRGYGRGGKECSLFRRARVHCERPVWTGASC